MDRIVDERAVLEKELALFLPEVALENMPPIPLHTISEFVNTGLDEGLMLRRLGEHLEDGAAADAPPRLLSLLFGK